MIARHARACAATRITRPPRSLKRLALGTSPFLLGRLHGLLELGDTLLVRLRENRARAAADLADAADIAFAGIVRRLLQILLRALELLPELLEGRGLRFLLGGLGRISLRALGRGTHFGRRRRLREGRRVCVGIDVNADDLTIEILRP